MSIEVMKQALEVLEEVEQLMNASDWFSTRTDTLRAAIEQAENQEPVAWMYHGIRHDNTPHERPSLIWKPEYMDAMSAEKGVKAIPLYTAPPPRQWQGLTDVELFAIWVKSPAETEDRFAFVKTVMERLKEKNG